MVRRRAWIALVSCAAMLGVAAPAHATARPATNERAASAPSVIPLTHPLLAGRIHLGTPSRAARQRRRPCPRSRATRTTLPTAPVTRRAGSTPSTTSCRLRVAPGSPPSPRPGPSLPRNSVPLKSISIPTTTCPTVATASTRRSLSNRFLTAQALWRRNSSFTAAPPSKADRWTSAGLRRSRSRSNSPTSATSSQPVAFGRWRSSLVRRTRSRAISTGSPIAASSRRNDRCRAHSTWKARERLGSITCIRRWSAATSTATATRTFSTTQPAARAPSSTGDRVLVRSRRRSGSGARITLSPVISTATGSPTSCSTRAGSAPDAIWYGSRRHTFTSQPYTINGSYQIVSADFNGDGSDDLFFYVPGIAADYIWFGSSGRTFHSTLAPPINNPYRIAAGDFNGDGFGDVVLYVPGTAAGLRDGRQRVGAVHICTAQDQR